MLRSYLKIAYRSLKRHKLHTVINIAGLAVGLAACIVIGLYIRHELSYDHFHEKAERIYRVASEHSIVDTYEGSALTPQLLAPTLGRHLPSVAEVTRVERSPFERLVRVDDSAFYEGRFYFADSSFFEVFSFPFIRGNPATALNQPDAVVLTESMAEKYFPDDNPLGQTLSYESEAALTVTGVIKDVPSNSHLHFDFVARLKPVHDRWFMYSSYTYVVLQEGVSRAQVDEQLDRLVEGTINPQMEMGTFAGIYLQPLTRIHLYSNLANEARPTSDVTYLHLFGAIALIILAMACINYMNLSTARSMQRAKEVGMRKVLGARRGRLIRQFLGESAVLTLLALVGAIGLVSLALPLMNEFAGTTLSLRDANLWMVAAGAIGGVLIVGVLAGSYPAFYLSRFHPVQSLRGGRMGGRSAAWIRKGLIVAQFTCAIGLLIATAVIFQQLTHLRTKRLGFDKEHVVVVSDRGRALRTSYGSFKDELLRSPHVVSVASGQSPDKDGGYFINAGSDENVLRLRLVGVDFDYAETLDLNFLAGEPFSTTRQTDSTLAFVANEQAVAALGWEDPVGNIFNRFWQGEGAVVGVVEDFHMRTLREPIQPILLMLEPGYSPTLLVRLEAGGVATGLEDLQNSWSRFVPDRPLFYSFLDDQLAALYQAEERLAQIFGLFALLAIFVACLGLYGLAAFTAERRTKEIGIRKVLGASVSGLVALLSTDFLKLAGMAFVIAAPIVYFAVQTWLQGFAYRIELGPWVFIGAGALALMIALVAVSYQALRAALADPVEALRSE